MESGFGPMEPLQGCDLTLVSALLQHLPAIVDALELAERVGDPAMVEIVREGIKRIATMYGIEVVKPNQIYGEMAEKVISDLKGPDNAG